MLELKLELSQMVNDAGENYLHVYTKILIHFFSSVIYVPNL